VPVIWGYLRRVYGIIIIIILLSVRFWKTGQRPASQSCALLVAALRMWRIFFSRTFLVLKPGSDPGITDHISHIQNASSLFLGGASSYLRVIASNSATLVTKSILSAFTGCAPMMRLAAT